MFWMSGKINYHLTSGLNLLRRLALGALWQETGCTGLHFTLCITFTLHFALG
jgi:hypothetical protein